MIKSNIHDYKLNDLLFGFWLKTKAKILSKNKGNWQGNKHPNPILDHKLIDDRLDSLRKIRNPHLRYTGDYL